MVALLSSLRTRRCFISCKFDSCARAQCPHLHGANAYLSANNVSVYTALCLPFSLNTARLCKRRPLPRHYQKCFFLLQQSVPEEKMYGFVLAYTLVKVFLDVVYFRPLFQSPYFIFPCSSSSREHFGEREHFLQHACVRSGI